MSDKFCCERFANDATSHDAFVAGGFMYPDGQGTTSFWYQSIFPKVNADEWCGEWHPKDWAQFSKALNAELTDADK